MENENFKTINGVQYHISDLHKYWNTETKKFEYTIPETIALPNDIDCKSEMKHSLNSGTMPLIQQNFNLTENARKKRDGEKIGKTTNPKPEIRKWYVRPTKILKNGKIKTKKSGYYYKHQLKGYQI